MIELCRVSLCHKSQTFRSFSGTRLRFRASRTGLCSRDGVGTHPIKLQARGLLSQNDGSSIPRVPLV
jgi:hypothetical protein